MTFERDCDGLEWNDPRYEEIAVRAVEEGASEPCGDQLEALEEVT